MSWRMNINTDTTKEWVGKNTVIDVERELADWFVTISSKDGKKLIDEKQFFSKAAAIQMAKDYMKKHPRG